MNLYPVSKMVYYQIPRKDRQYLKRRTIGVIVNHYIAICKNTRRVRKIAKSIESLPVDIS